MIILCLPRDTSNAVSDTADAIDAESDAASDTESDAGAVDPGKSQLAKMVEFCLKAEQTQAILTRVCMYIPHSVPPKEPPPFTLHRIVV